MTDFPEWLTPQYSALHDALTNEIVGALDHCYASADAACSYWTEDGWISCSVSNIISWIKRAGFKMPDEPLPEVERRSTDEVHREWARWDEDWDPYFHETQHLLLASDEFRNLFGPLHGAKMERPNEEDDD